MAKFKMDNEIMAVSFLFWPHFGPELTSLEQALPRGPQRASLCFWNQQSQENGINYLAKSNSNFFDANTQRHIMIVYIATLDYAWNNNSVTGWAASWVNTESDSHQIIIWWISNILIIIIFIILINTIVIIIIILITILIIIIINNDIWNLLQFI